MTSVAGVALLTTFFLASACDPGRLVKTPATAPVTGLEVLWQRDIAESEDPRAPWPAASESSVFLVGPKIGLSAHAATDGSPQWTSERTSVVPPVIAGSRVVIASEHEVILVKQDQDAVAWTAETGAPPSAIFAFGERVGAVVGPSIMAWDALGSRVWQAALGAKPCTPAVFANDTLFVGLEDASLVAIDAAAGTERWRIPLPAKPESLAAAGNQLFLSTVNAHLYGYPTTGEAKHLWDFAKIRTIGQPAADGRLVYFALLDNAVHAYERNGGSERWNLLFTDRPLRGPIELTDGFAVALLSGEVLLMTPAGHVVQPATPVHVAPSTSLQSAVTSAGGARVFTVTTAPDSKRLLTAWGAPSLRVSGK